MTGQHEPLWKPEVKSITNCDTTVYYIRLFNVYLMVLQKDSILNIFMNEYNVFKYMRQLYLHVSRYRLRETTRIMNNQ